MIKEFFLTKKNQYIAAGVAAFIVLAVGTAFVLSSGDDSPTPSPSKKTTASKPKKKDKTPAKTAKSTPNTTETTTQAGNNKNGTSSSAANENATGQTQESPAAQEVPDPTADQPPLPTYQYYSEPRIGEKPTFANNGLASYIAKETKLDVREATIDTVKSNMYISYYAGGFKNDDEKVLNLAKSAAAIIPVAYKPGFESVTVDLKTADPAAKDVKDTKSLKSTISIEVKKGFIKTVKTDEWKTVSAETLIRSASYFYIDPKVFGNLKNNAIKQAIIEQQQKTQ